MVHLDIPLLLVVS
jgi:hypothetical protein